MARILIADLITKDLGYCCEWFFFQHYKQVPLVAARLGVTPQAVRSHKRNCGNCKGKKRCLHEKITLAGTARKVKPSP